MPTQKAIVGIFEGKHPSLDILALDSTGCAVSNRRIVEAPEVEFHSLIEKLGEDKFVTLSKIKNMGSQIIFCTTNGKTANADSPEKSNLMSLFADQSKRKVYSWDANSKKVVEFNENGEITNEVNVEGMPSCYAMHNGNLIIGFYGGDIFYGNRKMVQMNGQPSKLVVSNDRLIALASETIGHQTFAMPAMEFSLPDFKPVDNSKINRQMLEDFVEHNGRSYCLINNAVESQSDGHTKREKLEGAGKIFSLHPLELNGRELLIYRTSKGLYVKPASSSESAPLEKKSYKSIVII